MGNSQLPRPRIGLKRTSAASVRGWPGQPSGASRGPPLWLSVYLPGEADHREEGTACQVCILHHPLDHHGCWMDGRSRTLKDFLGRDCKEAWLTGAIVPGGIMGIWTRNLYGGMRTSIFLGAFGWIYQYSTNNNLTNTISPNYDNPNMPRGRFAY